MGAKRIDGEIDRLDVGNLSLEVNNTKLEVGPSAMVLVDCKPANLSDLEEGSKVKAAYEERAGRNVVTVIEAEKKQRRHPRQGWCRVPAPSLLFTTCRPNPRAGARARGRAGRGFRSTPGAGPPQARCAPSAFTDRHHDCRSPSLMHPGFALRRVADLARFEGIDALAWQVLYRSVSPPATVGVSRF